MGGPKDPPGRCLFRLFGRKTEGDAAVERDSFNLDVEAIAVFMRPGAADAGPESFAAIRVADMECVVGWRFGG